MNDISPTFPDVVSLPGVPGTAGITKARATSFAVRLLTKGRIIKMGFGGSILFAAALALISERGYIASNNAVVSANLVSLRVPIDGYVSDLDVRVGLPVSKGTRIGQVENPRLNIDYLSQLQFSALRDQLDSAAIAREASQLVGERRTLEEREALYRSGSTTRLQQLTSQEEDLANAKDAQREEAAKQLDRERELAREGIVSRADLERVQRQYDVANHDARAERSALEAARIQLTASTHGILLENGTSGESSAQQRIDEVDIRLTETARALAQAQNAAAAAKATLSSVAPRMQMMRSAELLAPVNGAVWKVSATGGEHVAAGDTLVQFVDCNTSFVIAAIPQDRVPDVAINGRARIRLSGENSDRTGSVLSIVGQRHPERDTDLAATPNPERVPTAMVYIALDQSAAAKTCLVGRTARVLLPVTHHNLLAILSPGSR